ncbi:uncharacterized protein LOC114282674 [Camellia sinensis]|uniref:uncharacterized protein LOC114282674 n=1 Tax=Camellia sinensis TaxID=4442 RepID=UPI0010361A5F|nr:uncharacterized protein LOC114282674 [Camellia sinensis]
MEFDMSDLGMMHYFLGIEVVQSPVGIFMSQKKYVRDILDRFRMKNCNSVSTPTEIGLKLIKDPKGRKVNSTLYKQIVGSLLYLTATRPDIMHAVSLISKYMECPREMHLLAAKRIFRYLQGTVDLGLFYKKGEKSHLYGYTDSDYAGDPDDRRSTSGSQLWCFTYSIGVSQGMADRVYLSLLPTSEGSWVTAARALRFLKMAGTSSHGGGFPGLYPLCFAIVDSESYDSWHWFLSKLFVILTPGRDIAFVTDRHGGLLKALAEVFPFSSYSFCLMHLKINLKAYLLVKSRESKEYMLTLFSRYAYTPTIELFNELFEEFKDCCGRSVEKFLEDLTNECWCNAYFQGKRYGEMCTNVVESFNSWITDERHLFSTSLVDAIRVKLMEQFSKRREVGNKWNCIVCPFAEKKLEEAFNDTKAWIVKKCSDDIYEI